MPLGYVALAEGGMPAGQLAKAFIEDYFEGAEPEYPVNPFEILKDCGVMFSFRPFVV
jgi:hypothetical protein